MVNMPNILTQSLLASNSIYSSNMNCVRLAVHTTEYRITIDGTRVIAIL